MRRIDVHVTAEDIANGVPCQSGECPITLACTRAAPHDTIRYYDPPHLMISIDGSDEYGVRLPDEAAEFARAFDNGHAVEPFSFTFDIPDIEDVYAKEDR